MFVSTAAAVGWFIVSDSGFTSPLDCGYTVPFCKQLKRTIGKSAFHQLQELDLIGHSNRKLNEHLNQIFKKIHHFIYHILQHIINVHR